jgi:hypothetical protein
MPVWYNAMIALLQGKTLPSDYVYLPIYAEFLSSIFFPFYMMNIWSSEIGFFS